MVIDAERCLLATIDKTIFLTCIENIVLNLIIQNKDGGITTKYLKKMMLPYYSEPSHIIARINKKIFEYAQIYREKGRYKIHLYKKKLS